MLDKAIKNNVEGFITIPWAEIRAYEMNDLKQAADRDVNKLKNAIVNRGFSFPFYLWAGHKYIIDGAGRTKALRELEAEGYDIPDLPVVTIQADSYAEAKTLVLHASSEHGLITVDTLKAFTADIDITKLLGEVNLHGFDLSTFVPDLGSTEMQGREVFGDENTPVDTGGTPGALAAEYGVPPFSILDRRSPRWQARKRSWHNLGIRSEAGRSDDLVFGVGSEALAHMKIMNTVQSGTSIFDPVLCELLYQWFCPPGGLILDPFAGGSVRGVVGALLGRHYIGVDLRQEQCDENTAQWADIHKVNPAVLGGDATPPTPMWIKGNSKDVAELTKGKLRKNKQADLLFSCPPYADLEKYSDDPEDLSNMPYTEFIKAYGDIIGGCYSLVSDDAFAIFTVSEVRDKKGNYYNFVGDTISAFINAGFKYYNEIILINACGSLPLRVGPQMRSSRKVGRTHQNVLVFLKGDAKKATDKIGPPLMMVFDSDEAAPPDQD